MFEDLFWSWFFPFFQFLAGNDADEFSTVLKQQTVPKVLITTCRYNSSVSPLLLLPAFLSSVLLLFCLHRYIIEHDSILGYV